MKFTDCTSFVKVAAGPERVGSSANFIAKMGYGRKEINFFNEIKYLQYVFHMNRLWEKEIEIALRREKIC